jgi:hypothetical protein
MTAEGKLCSSVYKGQIVSGEGFTYKNDASVATKTVSGEGFTPLTCGRFCGGESTQKQQTSPAFKKEAETGSTTIT